MPRNIQAISLLLLFFLNACTGYKTVSIPWEPTAPSSDFSHSPPVEKGDKVRLTGLDGSVTEGYFVSMDSLFIILDSSLDQADQLPTDIESVLQFEVKGISTLKTLCLVAAGVAVIATIAAVSAAKKVPAETVDMIFGDPK